MHIILYLKWWSEVEVYIIHVRNFFFSQIQVPLSHYLKKSDWMVSRVTKKTQHNAIVHAAIAVVFL